MRRSRGLSLGSAILLCCITTGISALERKPGEARLKYEEPKMLTGAIYARGSDRQKLLFRFKRQATRSGSTLRVLRDYIYPNGQPAAQEEVVYEGNNLASFVLREFQIGAEGSARISRGADSSPEGTIRFEYVKASGRTARTRTEPLRENTLIGDMVAPFLADHWQELMRGEKVKCRYMAVPRLETVGFSFVKDTASTTQNAEAISIRMEPTSRIIAALVDPLFFGMEKAPPHRVLQYNGRTTPKLDIRGKWEDLDAVTVFDWK